MPRRPEPDQRDNVAYALQMLRLYAGAFVRLGFGEWEEVSVRGAKLMRSILQADLAALLLLEDGTYRCGAVRGLPEATVRRWAPGNVALDHLVAVSARPGQVRFEGPELAGAAAEIGLVGEVLAVPMFDINASKGRVAISIVSGPWSDPDKELTLSVLEIMSTLLAGAIANCQLRRRYQQLYIELDEAREAAEEHLRTKNRFLARMSHELRTPLNIIIGYSELIQEEMDDGESEIEGDLVRPIHDSGYHLLSIINDMLDISKLQSSEVRVDVSAVDLMAVTRQVVGEVTILARAQRNEVILEGGLPPSAYTDAKKLRQILYNLLSNACKFTADGQIAVRVWQESSEKGNIACFSVTDQGIGIPPEQLDRIFEEFVQVDDSTTRRFGGTGLGLAVSRSFARLLGGDISVRSVLGDGSTFEVRILCDLRTAVMPGARGNRQILVVAPPGSERDLVCRFLERCDYSTVPADPGSAVFDAVLRALPLAVVIDTAAWEEGAPLLLERLEADPRTRAVRRVILHGSDSVRPTQRREDWVITKPITPERLVSAVGGSPYVSERARRG